MTKRLTRELWRPPIPMTDALRLKRSRLMREQWRNPAMRATLIAAQIAGWDDPLVTVLRGKATAVGRRAQIKRDAATRDDAERR